MIGNDLVDLRDADARPESFRPRFDERVFSDEERRSFARDASPLARRWAHWGAKEAAYKLARQIDSTYVFSPARLLPRFETEESVILHHATGLERRGRLAFPSPLSNELEELEIRSFETAERVHVVAVPLGADWGSIDLGVETIDVRTDDPSLAVRNFAIGGISRSLGIEAKRISIGREGRVPIVQLDGVTTSLSISLSHHGRWIAYAMRIHLETPRRSAGANAWVGSRGADAGRA